MLTGPLLALSRSLALSAVTAQQKCYIVATCDRDLKRRIRKQPGVPIMYIKQHQFTIERMPDAYGAPNI